jgi:hypothetical protein
LRPAKASSSANSFAAGRFRHARQLAQEIEHRAGGRRHARRQRVGREVRKIQQPRGLVPQRQDLAHDPVLSYLPADGPRSEARVDQAS